MQNNNRSTIEIPKYKCLRCEHEWIPRSENYPRVCPKCMSPYWDKPRKTEINEDKNA